MGELSKGGSLLFVEDDPIVAATMSAALRRAGYAVTLARSVMESTEALRGGHFDVAVLDMLLPDGRGTEVAAMLRAGSHTAVVMLTAFSEPELIRTAIDAGTMSYLVKPVTPAQLMVAIEAALARGREVADLRQARARISGREERRQEVNVATGIIMERLRLCRDQAFSMLRAEARAGGGSIAQAAGRLIHAAEVVYGHGESASPTAATASEAAVWPGRRREH